jgi:hypothetical protein
MGDHDLHGATAKQLGIAVLLLPVSLAAILAVAWLVPSGAIVSIAVLLIVLCVFVLLAWTTYRFWKVAVGGPSEALFRYAFILGIGIPVGSIVLDNVLSWVGVGPPALIVRSAVYGLLVWLPVLLFAVGLIRSGWVPVWIPTIGVMAAVAGKVGLGPVASSGVQTLFGTATSIIELVALVALGVALLQRSNFRPEDSDEAVPGSRAEQALPADSPSVS